VWNTPPGTEGRALVSFAKAFPACQTPRWHGSRHHPELRPGAKHAADADVRLDFEGIGRSPRHESSIAVRFPRMLRWCEDKPVEEADSLQTLAALLPGQAV
jgi:DNA ligase-1